MPVHIEMRLIRLALRFDQRRRIFEESHTELMRAGGNMDASFQMRINFFVVFIRFPRFDAKGVKLIAIQKQFQFVCFAQSFYLLVTIPSQADLNIILAFSREGVWDQCATPCAERQTIDVILLCQVRTNPERIPAGMTRRRTNGKSADFFRRLDIPIEKSW